MLCTRCAALVGCWMTHHMANATAAHVRTDFRFTAASLEAQTSPFFASFPFILAQPGPDGDPSRCDPGHARSIGCSMPGTPRRYACVWVRVCASARQYAAGSSRPEAATPAQ